ncbi:MAG TPA: NUDIX domain-containing protein [Candidatus Dojkabacteria bacterium]|nr:NUDIX domain-containing protein [Candidatus Dojkabacteria bacterium]
MTDLHKMQMLILRELLFNPNSRFTDLNIQGLSTDHFSYHVNVLIKEGYVKKDNSKYSLTTKGKEYANRMDTDEACIERQPKIAVMIVATKTMKGKKYLLVQERTKEPYFGYSGFITGKIRYGEKVLETAKRELKEESGLECSEMHIKRIVHDHVVLEDTGELVEDKMFYVIHIVNPTGELISTLNGKNVWITEKEFKNLKKKYYNEDKIYEISQLKGDMNLVESTYLIKEF